MTKRKLVEESPTLTESLPLPSVTQGKRNDRGVRCTILAAGDITNEYCRLQPGLPASI